MENETKVCSRCGQPKSILEFGLDQRNKKDGHQSRCKLCDSETHRLRYQNNPNVKDRVKQVTITLQEQRRLRGLCITCGAERLPGHKRFCEKHAQIQRESVKRIRLAWISQGLCARCGKNPPQSGLNNCEDCNKQCRAYNASHPREWNPTADQKKRHRAQAKIRYQELRAETFNAYGGPLCACCGESTWKFLSIDHINNDGAKRRRLNLEPGSGLTLMLWLKRNNWPAGYQILCFQCNFGKRVNGGICPHKESDGEVKEHERNLEVVTA